MNKASNDRREAILRVVRNSKPLPPSIRDIQEATGIPSTSVVNYYLNKLEAEGKIRRIRDKKGNCVARGNLPVEPQIG